MANDTKTFIGSSREAMKYANAIHSQLSRETLVTPWFASTFGPNDYTMEALERELDQHDYGIFALTRGKLVFVTRDNTIFEMGLFWGILRKDRVFAIVPRNVPKRDDLIEGQTVSDFHLMSDLTGLTLLEYDIRPDQKYEAAVSVACQEIINKIQQLGAFKDPRSVVTETGLKLHRKQSVLHFFWEYNKNVHVPGSKEKYDAISEAIRNSILAPNGFRVTGAALWQKQGSDGIGQVGGNVGKGKSYPFNINQDKTETQQRVYVVDVFLSGDWTFYEVKKLAQGYVLCYPLGTEHVLSVHFSGSDQLDEYQLREIVENNGELLATVDYLIGGDSV
ncbi:TIR domain-containing protein [Brevibacillus centrosporus]|uniref:TIR domain-containing protein n=1 Tax=Brevibacillus centrosporus TaxID=54910 RepID=UPI003D233577